MSRVCARRRRTGAPAHAPPEWRGGLAGRVAITCVVRLRVVLSSLPLTPPSHPFVVPLTCMRSAEAGKESDIEDR